MKTLYKSIACIFFCIFYTNAFCLMCYMDDSTGKRWYSMVGKPTKTLGLVANIKPCKETFALRVEASTEDARCLTSAMAACDATWGGIRLAPNPQEPAISNQCLYFKVASDKAEDGKLYYRNLSVYDGTLIDEFGNTSCKP